MKKSKIKPILAGTALIIPVVALIGGAKDANALSGIKTTANKITAGISKIPGKTVTNLKNPGIKLNINKINITGNKSSINTQNKVNKVNTTTSTNNPVYENVLSVTPSTNKTTNKLNSKANRPLPDTPTSQSSTQQTTTTSSGLKKRPAYNPNKGQAPKPNTNKTQTNKLTAKKEPVYDKVADDEPIYNDGSSLMKKPTLNKTQSSYDDEHIYETID